MRGTPIGKFSVEEYFRMDADSQPPLEYHDGEVFQIDGADYWHGLVCSALCVSLGNRLEGTPCNVAVAPRVRTTRTNDVHPDLVVVSGKPVFTGECQDTIANPKLVIEILSPATADYDFSRKLELYRGLPSIDEYILAAQDRARIDTFRRLSDGNWRLSAVSDLEATLRLESLNIAVPLAEIYRGVELRPADSLPPRCN